jgi:antitoxin ChpS
MLALPPAVLDLLALRAGSTGGVSVTDGRLVIEPRPGPRYSLDELLAASDYSGDQPSEEREWVDTPAQGAEIL